MVPISARGSYVIQAYPFEFPISLGLGMNFSRLKLTQPLPHLRIAGG